MHPPLLRSLAAIGVLTLAAVAAPASAAPGIILSPTEFQSLSQKGGVKVLDVRSKAEYDRGHLPGAIHLPWQALNVSERDGIRNEYADDADIEKALRAAGISYDDTLLIYGATTLAGRAFVVLEYAGFEKLHVLDGGASQWKGKLTTAASTVKPSDFKLDRKRENRVEQDYVAGQIDAAGTVILDGRQAAASEDGVIPSAKFVPTPLYVDAKTSALRPREEVLAELAAQGITPDKEVISYCGSGANASNSYLFLKELGFDNVKFYDKSWDEWSRGNRQQAISHANFSFAGDALSAPGSLGPRFLDETQVKALQKEGKAIVVDVRPPDDFVVGRIPDSVNVYWNDTLDAERNLKSAEDLKALFAKQGVTPDKHVVIFARGGLQLSQAYTVLKLLGYEKVDVFAGKWEGWVNPAYGPVKS